jgi:hypothetical protein
MSNEAADRKACREALAVGLTNAVPLAQVVYAYEPHDFDLNSPVVTVNSMGSERPRGTVAGTYATFYFDVAVWVLYSDSANNYTEQDAENLIDQIEQQIAAYLAAPREQVLWNKLSVNGQTQAGYQVIGGNVYRTEIIPLRMEVYRQ